MTFGERLKTARKKMGLTQRELEALAGMPASSIAQFETGAREPSLRGLGRIVRALRVSADYLLDVDIASLWGMPSDAAVRQAESAAMVCDRGEKCELCDASLRHNG